MYDYHTDSKGNRTVIPMLSDTHLLNIIRHHCSIITEASCNLANTDNLVTKALLNLNTEEFEKIIRLRHKVLYPYIMEAALRGLEITPILQNTYNRNSAIPDNLIKTSPDAREWGLNYEDTF